MSDFNWPFVICAIGGIALYLLLVLHTQHYHNRLALKHARERIDATTVAVYPRPVLFDQDAEDVTS